MLKKYLKTGLLPLFIITLTSNAFAHCDTLDGPVIKDARIAIEKNDITPVLKWVKNDHDEKEINQAFINALKIRGKGADMQEVADHYFFETLIRVHRTGEGVSYTGLKPANSAAPAYAAADKALDAGSVDKLAKKIAHAVEAEIKKRFIAAKEKRTHKEESVKDGRQYVEAYVQYIHFVEAIHGMVAGGEHGHGSDKSHNKH